MTWLRELWAWLTSGLRAIEFHAGLRVSEPLPNLRDGWSEDPAFDAELRALLTDGGQA